jgi:hypothetical protein
VYGLLGDMAAGRLLPPQWRRRSVTPLRFLFAVPYLLFALPLSLPVAAGAQPRPAAVQPPDRDGSSA